MNADEPVIKMCDEGHHKFYKLPDHPKNSLGNSVCPYCLVIGRKRLETEIEALKKQAEFHRWNIEEDGNDFLICKNDHEKSELCEYVRYARVDKSGSEK